MAHNDADLRGRPSHHPSYQAEWGMALQSLTLDELFRI